MIKVTSFKKLKGGKKKYEITFKKNGKIYTRKFGAQGMSDFTIHKDRSRRERYISRHKKDLRTNDPMKPGYLSMYILWNKPTLKASLADYKRRLSVYNRTGKFPKGITGSKKLKFGTTNIPFDQTTLGILPGDVQNIIRDTTGARIIQDQARKYNPKRSLIEALKIRGLKRYQDSAKRTENPRENMHFLNKLWTNLDPVNDFTAQWLTRASKVLTKKDFDFKTRNFWWKVIENQLLSISEIEEELIRRLIPLPENESINYERCKDAIIVILNKAGYSITNENLGQFWSEEALIWWKSKRTNTFGAIIPFEDTSLNVLPGDVQNLIQRDVSAADIQKIQRGRKTRANPKNMMTKKYLKQLLWKMNAEYESPEYATEQMTSAYGEPWLILNPARRETSQWLYYAADILTAQDFENDDLWYLCIEHIVDEFVDMNPDVNRYEGQVASNLAASEENLEIILAKIGYYVDFDHPGWYTRALYWLQEEYATGNAFGKKNTTGGSKIPDNVVNKKLYASIKAKIKRSIKGRRWGAYDSGRLVREYKAKGGKYRGSKGKTDLSRWYKEKWVDACAWPKRKPCGRKTKEKIAYCRPSVKVDSKTPKLVQKLTKAQIKSRCAKKKKNPMKRVTKFGETTADEAVAYGDGGWVIHCSYHPWGAHSTIRYKPLSRPLKDYSYHYGIYNDGSLRLWATGQARNTQIPQALQSILVNYYNTRCTDILKTQQSPQSFYISDQYGTMTFGKNQELLDKMRQQMFKQVMSSSDVNTGIQNTIIKRCKRGFSDQFCQDIFTQLLLSIYFTIVSKSKITPLRKNNLKEMESFIPSNFKPTMLNITKGDFSKIDEMLYLLQDHTYGNFKNARVASLIYEYIYQK